MVLDLCLPSEHLLLWGGGGGGGGGIKFPRMFYPPPPPPPPINYRGVGVVSCRIVVSVVENVHDFTNNANYFLHGY